ncbi:MAG: ribosome biogenesis GTP-binding protein YihA/YsxC [Bacteroidales bacterium]|jgi:GTP-binding protein|nr:ribosome biogenesis GTP-binding protein YihA/YsxC [Bacteroidales bacterium]
MEIKNVEFVVSSSNFLQCPQTDKPEIAFIGRSNVGKSSLINMIVNRKGLAKTSSQPGKTQLINHFLVNNQWYLVDLPGYGYAKISKKQREKFSLMIKNYILKRENLITTFVLVDSRIDVQKLDIEFINFLGEKKQPLVIIFTKIDKQSKNETNKNIEKFCNELKNYWSELPDILISSAETKVGREEILNKIKEIIAHF